MVWGFANVTISTNLARDLGSKWEHRTLFRIIVIIALETKVRY